METTNGKNKNLKKFLIVISVIIVLLGVGIPLGIYLGINVPKWNNTRNFYAKYPFAKNDATYDSYSALLEKEITLNRKIYGLTDSYTSIDDSENKAGEVIGDIFKRSSEITYQSYFDYADLESVSYQISYYQDDSFYFYYNFSFYESYRVMRVNYLFDPSRLSGFENPIDSFEESRYFLIGISNKDKFIETAKGINKSKE